MTERSKRTSRAWIYLDTKSGRPADKPAGWVTLWLVVLVAWATYQYFA